MAADADPAACPECGAIYPAGWTCDETLGWVLGWEQTDLALARLHFVTVACFNLQHPSRFLPEALDGLLDALRRFFDEGASTEEIRRAHADRYAGAARVLRSTPSPPVLRSWPITVADIWADGDARGAAGRVRAWATTLRSAAGPDVVI